MFVVRLRLVLTMGLLIFGPVVLEAQLQPVTAKSNGNTNTPSHEMTVAWNPSPGSSATGYDICWGISSGECTNRIDVGNVTNATLTGWETNVTYYLSAVAYNDAGQHSVPSNQIEYKVPANSSAGYAPPLKLYPVTSPGGGVGLQLSFQGRAGTTYEIEATRDFQQWDIIWSTNCMSDGLVVFLASDSTLFPSRFYRLVQQ